MPAPSPGTFVQYLGGNDSGNMGGSALARTYSFGYTHSVDTTIIVCITQIDSTAVVTAVTDTAGNTWIPVGAIASVPVGPYPYVSQGMVIQRLWGCYVDNQINIGHVLRITYASPGVTGGIVEVDNWAGVLIDTVYDEGAYSWWQDASGGTYASEGLSWQATAGGGSKVTFAPPSDDYFIAFARNVAVGVPGYSSSFNPASFFTNANGIDLGPDTGLAEYIGGYAVGTKIVAGGASPDPSGVYPNGFLALGAGTFDPGFIRNPGGGAGSIVNVYKAGHYVVLKTTRKPSRGTSLSGVRFRSA